MDMNTYNSYYGYHKMNTDAMVQFHINLGLKKTAKEFSHYLHHCNRSIEKNYTPNEIAYGYEYEAKKENYSTRSKVLSKSFDKKNHGIIKVKLVKIGNKNVLVNDITENIYIPNKTELKTNDYGYKMRDVPWMLINRYFQCDICNRFKTGDNDSFLLRDLPYNLFKLPYSINICPECGHALYDLWEDHKIYWDFFIGEFTELDNPIINLMGYVESQIEKGIKKEIKEKLEFKKRCEINKEWGVYV